ncbi:MAG TPA: DUF359 domain-containing protein [Candidatus Paceibacterota bacterium]|nr:DUF359 domain-containing protein [Candidatus Pacearchaeota archaeon]HRZ51287.1 DUF359 domain-containing protein [Candidatus Paceibacterota bacterium]HSA37009.1 DUF359 domain-containing protein [Candidatus Paceibacterota bacterium]
MNTLFLPEKSRPKLQEAWGIPFYGSASEVESQYNKFIKEKKYRLIITVGDYCSFHLRSDIKIFDRKVQRKNFEHKMLCAESITNKPGTIQKESWNAIKKAFGKRTNLCVDGEEDLLVIPAVLQAKDNDLIVYGLPNQGICLLEVTPALKKQFRTFLKKNFSAER